MSTASRPTLEDLLGLYSGILKSLLINTTPEGIAYMDLEGTHIPVAIGEKTLILPTAMALKDANWNQYMAFHPLSENVYRSESVVLKKLKGLINQRLTSVISRLFIELTDLAADPESIDKLTPQQKEIFSLLPKANGKTSEKFAKVFNSLSISSKSRLINIYIKRGGKYRGEDYSQVAVTTFPVRDYFDNEDNTIFDINLGSKKDMSAFKALWNYILPLPEGDEEFYNHGSRSFVAPRFDALLHAYLKVAKKLNSVTWLFRKHLEDSTELMINHEWEKQLEELAIYRDLVPALEGNNGDAGVEEQQKAVQPPPPVPEGLVYQPRSSAPPVALPPEPWNSHPAYNVLTPPLQAPLQAPPYVPGYIVPQPQLQQPPADLPLEENPGQGLSWANLMERKQRAAYGGTYNRAPYPPQPMVPPPGFAGTPYNPQQQYYNQQPQQLPPGAYAYHPRNQPPEQYYPQQPQQWPPQQNYAVTVQPVYQQQFYPDGSPVYPGGIQ